ncbi:hypothetical protein ACFY15_27610 [Streptomyces sp. NPDC001373]|uniref:hypothetical protein n=1 Tax=Streptomyces sp. NPDC001373 TaxID=3364565 RepID=UPI00367E1756
MILGNLENKLQALKRRPIADPAQLAEVQQEVKTAQEKVDTDQRTVEAAERALYDCETGIDKPPVQP